MTVNKQCQSLWVDEDPYPGVNQLATLVDPVQHFWDMSETGSPSVITDIVGGATISGAIVPGPDDPYVNILADTTNGNIITGGVAIGDRDFMLISVARSVADPGNPANNGHTGFYWQGANYAFKTHPYYAVPGQVVRTLPYPPNWTRTEGQIYTHAAVRRGSMLESYILPRGFVDALDMNDFGLSTHVGYLESPTITYLGHGGYGTPYNNGVGQQGGLPNWDNSGDVAQDYAGLAVLAFSNGAPSMEQIVKGLRWVENEWTTKTSGKRMYPGWIQ